MTRQQPTVSFGAACYITIAFLLFLASLGVLIALSAKPAGAHEAIPTAAQPLGWTYDYSCCSSTDCREVKTKAVKEDETGFTITATGEIIPHGDSRIHRSKDEFYHWCSVAGADDSRSICLYVPDKGL
jgi:hypothetical protein